MPIITPAFPSMNTTHNVSQSTMNIILTELEKGKKITEYLVDNASKELQDNAWKRLFKPFNFFQVYKHFIQIWILSNSSDNFKKWSGWIESKLRRLLQNFEKLNLFEAIRCMELRPWPRSYKLKNEKF